MDEETKQSSPEAPDQNSGGTDVPTPDESTETLADNTSSNQASQDDSTPDDAPQDELLEFGKSRGFSEEELENPAVIKALKQAKDSKAASDKNFQQMKEAEKKIGDFGKKADVAVDEAEFSDPIELDVAQIKADSANNNRKMATAMFFTMNPEAVPYIDKMDSIAEERPYLYNDLDLLLEIAQGRSTDIDSAKEAGRKEAEERLARGQQAGAPARSASNSAPKGKNTFTRSQINAMSRGEYEENRAAIIAAEQAGTVVDDM